MRAAKILELMDDGENYYATDIAAEIPGASSAINQELRRLVEAGYVEKHEASDDSDRYFSYQVNREALAAAAGEIEGPTSVREFLLKNYMRGGEYLNND